MTGLMASTVPAIPIVIAAALLIRARVRSLRRLKDNEALYAGIYQGATDPIVTFDQCGVVHSCNPAAVALLAYESEDIIGNDMENVDGPDANGEARPGR